ncbi:MAG TPA: alpha/beta hydrolase [Steroidobacteraceae bacterium]|nr:alpha/beta hydrolase [Steroidobacteraceae bacterium]
MPGVAANQRISRRVHILVLVLLAAVLPLGACSKRAPEPPKPVDTATTSAGGERAVPSEDGVAISYRVLGKGEPALIFIHGWCADSTYWDAQLDAFSRRYTVVTLDLAGHGDSGTARAEWTMDAFGDDVVSVAKQIPNRQLVLVGHSMGGPVALEAARRLKGRVIGIVGVDTFGNIGLPQATRQDLDSRLEPFRHDFPTAMRDYATHRLFTPRSDPELVRRIADDMASEPAGIAIGALIGLNTMNFSAALGDISVPIVAINSDRFPTDVDRIRLHAPTFRVKVMPGVGNFLMIEDPTRFNALLGQTVQELVTRAERKGTK